MMVEMTHPQHRHQLHSRPFHTFFLRESNRTSTKHKHIASSSTAFAAFTFSSSLLQSFGSVCSTHFSIGPSFLTYHLPPPSPAPTVPLLLLPPPVFSLRHSLISESVLPFHDAGSPLNVLLFARYRRGIVLPVDQFCICPPSTFSPITRSCGCLTVSSPVSRGGDKSPRSLCFQAKRLVARSFPASFRA